jgi:hypothetical protein
MPTANSKSKTPVSKFVGDGGYGCTFSPPIPCKTNLQNKSKKKLLGKVFFDSNDMLYELEVYNKIMKIDPEGKLFPKVFPYSTCLINEYEHESKLNKCGKKFEHTTKFQIFQEYGGTNLHYFILMEKKYPKNPEVIIKKFKDLGDRLFLFNKKMFHNDIKIENIVIDDKFNLKLIDASLIDKKPVLKFVHEKKIYYPFEHHFDTTKQQDEMWGFYNENDSINTYIERYIYQINYYAKSNYKKMFNAAKKDIEEWYKGGLKIENHDLFDSYSLGLVFIYFMNNLYPSWTEKNIMKLYPIVNPNPLKRLHIADVLKKLLSSKR